VVGVSPEWGFDFGKYSDLFFEELGFEELARLGGLSA
jgi:hypothetical protein